MILFKATRPLQDHLKKLADRGLTIGFVPTMGALHNGHLSLIKQCRKQCDVTVCSIFVNPTQFNDKKDFEKYPVTTENDILLLETSKTDVLFLPSVEEIYTGGLDKLQHFNLGYLENILEGKYRPGHFQGVCNVVYRLLNIIMPNVIFLGRKDYQQYLVLRAMMQEFYPSVKVSLVDIAREPNGLAMSSRNMRLSEDGLAHAVAIYQALLFIKQNILEKDIDTLKSDAEQKLLQHGFDKVDYVEICHADTLLPVNGFDKNENLIALIAAFMENVRLIDNMVL